MFMDQEFDYKKALEELEALAVKAEDPSTGLDGIDALIARADVLIAGCREYLRGVRDRLDGMDTPAK